MMMVVMMMMMRAARSVLFPAAERHRRPIVELFLLAVVSVTVLPHALCNNSMPRSAIQKGSSQSPDLKLLDSLRPLRRTKRRWVITTLELEEEDKGPFPKFIGQLFNDVAEDVSVKYHISGAGVDEYPEPGLFSIEDDANGLVYVHRPIDREKTPSFTIHFDVANRETGEIVDRSLLFNVKINDINDNAPEFPEKEYNITMTEKQSRGNLIFNATAFDKDEEGTENSQVTYSMVSQKLRSNQAAFTLDSSTGEIRSTGCSNYEAGSTYKLLIKVTDHGYPPRSSTATINIVVEDSNNNMPTFIRKEYRVDVPEGKTEHDILRLPVEDKDSPNTAAWRAKYRIVRGNETGNFFIETDPKSNEGVLSIVKPLTYDGVSEKKLEISVENEEPYFFCVGGMARTQPSPTPSKARVTINVIDQNDAPQFDPLVLVLHQEEGVKPGVRIGQYIAKDPDPARHIVRYKIASDPDGWVTVDENSGVVRTAKTLDRESPHTNNSIYTVVIHAIDNGVPPLTGTGTIQLYLNDLNDNAPALVTPLLEVCDGEERGPFLVKAEDKDGHPYAGPFTFQIPEGSEDVQKVWRLGENFDDSVELFMLESLPPGNYSLPLHVSDKQGLFKEQILHVMVCSCHDGICDERLGVASVSVGLGGGAIGIIVAAFLLLLLALGLLLWCSAASGTKKGHLSSPYEVGNQSLIQYNEESKHVLSQDVPDVGIKVASPPEQPYISKEILQVAKGNPGMDLTKSSEISNQMNGMIGSPSTADEVLPPIPAWEQVTLRLQRNKMHWVVPHSQIMETVGGILNQKLEHVSNLEDNVDSYLPRAYAEEGHLEASGSAWSLPFANDDDSLPSDFLDSLGPRFAMLGRVCSK